MNSNAPFNSSKDRDFKIIDCSTFFNELDLLRLRIKLLENHVDHFVITEGRQTFTGHPKKCFLNQEHARDIINHPKVSIQTIDLPNNTSAWDREDFQRESMNKTAHELSTNENDIILLSDIDEIPSPEAIQEAATQLHADDTPTVCVFEQRLFYFRVNYELLFSKKLPWLGTTAIKAIHHKSMGCMRATGRNLRGRKHRHFFDKALSRKHIQQGGWHFSYLGGDDSLKQKFQSFSHQEAKVQAAKFVSINDLMAKRASLFHHEASHEIWAIVPLENLNLPDFILKTLAQSSLVAECPYTPAADIINDVLTKSEIARLPIGGLEISLNRRRKSRRLNRYLGGN